jgi:hypothetical protein
MLIYLYKPTKNFKATDPVPGSEFFNPGSRVKKIPVSVSASKNLSI